MRASALRTKKGILSALAIGALIALGYFGLGAKRISDVMGRENRLLRLQEQLNNAQDESRRDHTITSQLITAVNNSISHINLLTQLRQLNVPKDQIELAQELLKRVIESLASDIKHRSGERHRCGLWIHQDGELILMEASSGFPIDYLRGNRRRLSVHKSLAGKAFRHGQTKKWDDVTADEDWEPNLNSKSPYKALICTPVRLGDELWGVVTIDALKPMTDEDVLIGEFYNSIITNTAWELLKAVAAENDVAGMKA